jgi:hypothetical protein
VGEPAVVDISDGPIISRWHNYSSRKNCVK